VTRYDPATRCARCHAPLPLCYCHLLPKLACPTFVTLIVHRNEILRSTATASTTHLCLANSRILPYGRPNEPLDPANLLAPRGMPLYLFPDEDAEVLDADWVAAHPGPWHLVVPDGSWGQAVRMRRRVPILATMRAVCLADPGPSHYQLRTARGPGRLCTLEAVAHALALLEGPAVRDALLQGLAIQVERMKGMRPRFRNQSPRTDAVRTGPDSVVEPES